MSRLILGCMLLSAMAVGCAEQSPFPKAKRGVLDLTQWDFVQNGPVNLTGEWEIYWGKLLRPEDGPPAPDTTPFYATLPGLWKWHEIDGQNAPTTGFATYRLTVKINSPETPMALTVNRPLSVCKVWIDQKPLVDTGRVGTDMESEAPRSHMGFQTFQVTGNEMTVTLWVSNFHNMQGGMIDPIRFGSENQLRGSIHQRLIITALLGGVLLIMGGFHLMLYAMRPSAPANLYFGLYCILQSMGKMAGEMGVCLLAELIPGLPWRISIDMSLMPNAACIPLLVMFYHALFPHKHSRIAEKFYLVVGGGSLVYMSLTPPNAFDDVTLIFMFLGLTAFPYLFFRFALDLKSGKEGAGFMVPGFIVLVFAVINDLLLEVHFFETFQMAPFAMLFFILSYSFVISIRHSRTHTKLQVMYSELAKKNIQLFRQIRQTKGALERERKEKSEKLRYQLNPHFLFNTLASIRGAISRERDTARNMISHLSEFCRLTLLGGHKDILPVNSEIEIIRHYLEMERMRLGDYLKTTVEVEPSVEKSRLPALIIHPIVENAVKYGSQTSPDSLEVIIQVTRPATETLRIKVSNTGRWVDPATNDEAASNGIGLNNVRQRLWQYFGDTYGFEVQKGSGRVSIQIDLPGPL